MNRRILFRGKTSCTNKWIQGELIHNPGGSFITQTYYDDDGEWTQYATSIQSDTVCQYINQTDNNNQLMFEKDVCTVVGEDGYFVILWDNYASRFILDGDGLTIDFDNIYSNECEVVGNIFDDPELMDCVVE